MQTLGSIWSWFAMAAIILGGFFVQLALAVFTLPFDRRRYVCGRFFRLIGVACCKVNPNWRFAVHGPLPAEKPRRTVVVSNHASNADPFLVSFLPWEMKWLSKDVLFRVPVVGWLMWIAGDIPVRRGEKTSALEAMDKCKQWLDRGVPVMIFPEGTRSKDGNLQEFKDGAFRLAIEAGADLLPIAVAGTHTALPKHSWRFGTAHARVTVGKPISTAGMDASSVPALKAQARAQIEALLAELGGAYRQAGSAGAAASGATPG